MKIRRQFVSNSSSTSYVIALSRDIEITDEEKEKIRQVCMDCYNTDIENIDEYLEKALDELCSNEEVWQYSEDSRSEEYRIVETVMEQIVEMLGDKIVITSIHGAPDCGAYVNVMSDFNRGRFVDKIKKMGIIK